MTVVNDGEARSFVIHEDPVRRKDGSMDLFVHELFPASDFVLDLAIEGHEKLQVVNKVWARLRQPGYTYEQGSRGLFFEKYLPVKLSEMLGVALSNDVPLLFLAMDFKTGEQSVETH